MHDDERKLEEWLRAAIRSHLRGAPDAADTAEGIATWWVPRAPQGSEFDAPQGSEFHALLENVLGQLVAEGVMARVPLPDGSHLYAAHVLGSEDPGNTG